MNKLILNIDSEPSGEDKKTAAFPRRRSRKYGRRRAQSRINFWDLALISTGSGPTQWEQIDFQPSAAPWDTSAGVFDTSYQEELLDVLFDVPVTEWRNYYKRITPDMNYQISCYAREPGAFGSMTSSEVLSNSNPNFTNAGLSVPADWFDDGRMLRMGDFGPHFEYHAFRPTYIGYDPDPTISGTKVTTEYDPSAAHVEFTPSRKMDVFLVPALPYVAGYVHFVETGVTSYFQELNNFFWLYDRNLVLNSSHELYHSGGEWFPQGGYAETGVSNETQYQEVLAFIEYAKAMPNARGRYATGAPPYTTFDDGTNFGALLPGTQPTGIGGDDYLFEASIRLSAHGDGPSEPPVDLSNNQLLNAVIYQAGTYYYFWRNANT